MALFEPGARVEGELETYLAIRLLGAPAALVTMVLLGWLLGLQNARGPMLLLILTNGLNIALDLLFVLGFGWAVGRRRLGDGRRGVRRPGTRPLAGAALAGGLVLAGDLACAGVSPPVRRQSRHVPAQPLPGGRLPRPSAR